MDISRKIGTGITMIVPAFVFGGLFWSWFNSMIAVWLVLIATAGIYVSIITGRMGPFLRDASARAKADCSCFGKKKEAAK